MHNGIHQIKKDFKLLNLLFLCVKNIEKYLVCRNLMKI